MQMRLRTARKLTLVLDLDHTLLHATQDSRASALVDHHPLLCGMKGSEIFSFSDAMHTITVKLRPGVRQFLARMANLFELQVDTKGTRAYAARIVSILDPTGKLFGDRIVSRCDATMRVKQSTAWLHRALQDDSMVLIVDDREDMWPGARNLVVVEPYHFWGRELSEEVNNRSGAAIAAQAPPPAAVAAAAGNAAPASIATASAGGGSPPSSSPATSLSVASDAGSSGAEDDEEYDPLLHAQAAGVATAPPAESATVVAPAAPASSTAVDASPAAVDAPLVGMKRSRGQMLAEASSISNSDGNDSETNQADLHSGTEPSAAGADAAAREPPEAASGAAAPADIASGSSSGSPSAATAPIAAEIRLPAAEAAAAFASGLQRAGTQQHWALSISAAELAARWCAEPAYANQLDDVTVLLARAHAQYYRLYDLQQREEATAASGGAAGAATQMLAASSVLSGSAASSSSSTSGDGGAASAVGSSATVAEAEPLVAASAIDSDAAALEQIFRDDPTLGRSATKVAASAATAAAVAGSGSGAGAAAISTEPAASDLALQMLAAPSQLPLDTSAILQGLYRSVLRGVCVVFSGVFPLDIDVQRQLLYQRCLSFGACIADAVEPSVVHGCHFRREADDALAKSSAVATASGSDSSGTAAATAASGGSDASRNGHTSLVAEKLHTDVTGAAAAAAAASASSSSSAANGKHGASGGVPGACFEYHGSTTRLGGVVTHVVARRAGTQKIHDAVLRPGISVVGLTWLTDSINRFARQPEAGHALDPAHQRFAVPVKAAADARSASLRALMRAPHAESKPAPTSSSAAGGAERSIRRRIDTDDATSDASPAAAAASDSHSPAADAAAADAADDAAAASDGDSGSLGGSSPGLSLHDSDWDDAEPLDLDGPASSGADAASGADALAVDAAEL